MGSSMHERHNAGTKNRHLRSRTRMMAEIPMRLGELAESVMRQSKLMLFLGEGDGYTGRMHVSGDNQIAIDKFANVLVRRYVQDNRKRFLDEWGCSLVYLSEEQMGMPFTGTPSDPDPADIKEGDLVIVGDPIDGSTNAKCYGEGFATVLVAFLRNQGEFDHIGGAITAANGATVAWSGLSWVQCRFAGQEDNEWESISTAVGERSVSASVATKLAKIPAYMSSVENRSKFMHLMAGTPCVYPLLRLGLGTVVEQAPQKVWDAAHLIPALMANCSVRELEAKTAISLDRVMGYWKSYLSDFYNLRETPLVPPFRIDVPGLANEGDAGHTEYQASAER